MMKILMLIMATIMRITYSGGDDGGAPGGDIKNHKDNDDSSHLPLS